MRLTAAITFVGLVLTATPGMAAPILGTGAWRAGGAAQENNAVFWDGNSWDSESTFDGQAANPCNAGSLVAGAPCSLNLPAIGSAARAGLAASTFTMNTPGGAFEYYGNTDGSAVENFVFGEEGGAWYDFTLLGEFTSNWALNEFGFYNAGNPENRTVVFQDVQTVGALNSVYIPGDFGLYYRNTSGNGQMFFTQTMFNTLGADKQQFAAFQIGDQNFVGIEDLFSNAVTQWGSPISSDYDYNDVMIGFKRVASVPEPSSLLLMGMGLAGVIAKARRKVRA